MNRTTIAALLLGASLPAIGLSGGAAMAAGASAPAAAPAPMAINAAALGIRPDWMDTSVERGDDFYRYADGRWTDTTEIPADRTSWGGFAIADKATEGQLAELISEIVASDPASGTDAAKVKEFYTAYVDTDAIEAAGLGPILPDLERFQAISDKTELARVIGSQVRADVDPLNATNFSTSNLFGVFVTQALKGGQVVPYILQGGLGLPEREYYLSSDPKMAALRQGYRSYIEQALAAANISNPAARADRVMALETAIAMAHATREESDDWTVASQLWSRADFAAKAPGLDWQQFFDGAGLSGYQTFDAYHAGAIPKIAALVASQPLQAWKDWLVFHQIENNSAVLPARFDSLRFDFYGKQLAGQQEQRPREKRAIAVVNAYLGDALGRLYTEKYFPASTKAEISTMVDNIKTAFAQRIEAIDWMAPATKQEALAKVKSMTVGIGYPDRWKSYAGLQLSPGNAYADLNAAEEFRYRQQLSKIGKPQDRGEWWMNAQLVNAVNLPVQNALNFPAAILQPPFYDPKGDAASNYGATGATIGHEISHSFDNNGAAFDSTGAMRNWWTPSDLARFTAAGKALAAQFDTYEPFPGLHVKGDLTLGENIADLAGLNAAYDAYRASLNGKEAPVIGGFTGDQRFFIAYAQSWATKMREQALRNRIATDGHAPGQYRALTVRNMGAWYAAFDVQPGDALYLPPEKRVTVW